MECQDKSEVLRVETEESIYEIEFGQIQIEITGRCNMACEHCRASHELHKDMPVDQIVKILRFARRYSPNYKEVVISGGEPLIHRDFPDILNAVRENGGESIFLSTNGSLLEEEYLHQISKLQFKRFTVSVSLDSTNAQVHDLFRNYSGAFSGAVRALRLVAERGSPGIIASARVTLQPDQIQSMEEITDFVFRLGCNRISLSSIYPSGRSIDRPEFWMTLEQKKQFLEKVYALREAYPTTFQISTNDPLKCLVRDVCDDVGSGDEVVFDGCPAAAVTFNVGANGDMTPCALMNLPMFNVFGLTVDEIAGRYRESDIVKNMLDMNLRGKCSICDKKYRCGGCRARALARNGHYLAEDPDCWL